MSSRPNWDSAEPAIGLHLQTWLLYLSMSSEYYLEDVPMHGSSRNWWVGAESQTEKQTNQWSHLESLESKAINRNQYETFAVTRVRHHLVLYS